MIISPFTITDLQFFGVKHSSDSIDSYFLEIPASCDQNEAIIDNLINTKMRPLVQDNGGDVVFQVNAFYGLVCIVYSVVYDHDKVFVGQLIFIFWIFLLIFIGSDLQLHAF